MEMRFLVINVHFNLYSSVSIPMFVNATFSIAAMVIYTDAAVPETAQLACYLNQCLCVV
jgi:hypothetical protein